MIPRAELHVHAEGTATPDLVRAHAARNDVSLQGLFGADGGYAWSDFAGFLAAYDRASSVLRSEQAYHDLAYRYARRSAAEGVIYFEMFASPDHAEDAGLGYRGYIEGLDSGLAAAEAEFGIVARIVVVGVRHRGPEAVERAARLAAGDGRARVSGFGMAGDERHGRMADHARAFAIAADAGLGLTVHAGEFAGPESVRDALDHLPVRRIGHGVRAIEDRELVARLAAQQVTLEVCPGSNIALGLYPDRARHPLAALAKAGVATTLNSDDPAFFGTTVGEEYEAAARDPAIAVDPARFTANALAAAFVEEPVRAGLAARLAATGPAEGRAGAGGRDAVQSAQGGGPRNSSP